MRKYRITVLNRTEAKAGKFGLDSAAVGWYIAGTIWADVTWAKGKASMQAGALDAYAVIIVRMNWNRFTNERSRIVFEGKTYQILPDMFHPSWHENTIQFHAQVLINTNEQSSSDSSL